MVDVLVLAAGKGQRMGGCKALTRLGGQTFLERIAAAHRQADETRRVLVVTGAQAEAVAAHAAALGLETVHNPQHEAGMFTSILTGLAALAGVADGASQAVCLHPVDIPCIRPATLHRMQQAWEAQPDPTRLLLPVFEGRAGHPPVIGAGHFAAIASWAGSGGLAGYVETCGQVERVAVADEAIHRDADTPADLAALEAWLLRMDVPTLAEAEALLAMHQPNANVVAHCRAVATAARRLAVACGEGDAEAAFVAGLLHDIAKGQPRHAQAGAALVREAGFVALEEAIALHPGVPSAQASLLAQLVALADKYASGDEFVDLATRFGRKALRFAGNTEALQTIARRLEESRELEARLARRMSHSPLDVVQDLSQAGEGR